MGLEKEASMVNSTSNNAEIERIVKLQRAYLPTVKAFRIKDRIERIKSIRQAMFDYREEIEKAIYLDFKKPAHEVDMTEIYVVINEANHAIKRIKNWVRPRRVRTPLNMIGTSGWIKHEAKGNTLIIAPWNYPINLLFGPLISAIAAGNTAILKPSEYTPNTSDVIRKIIGELFDEREVAMSEGGVPETTELLKYRFDHIFFTGSSNVGKIVMRAAAENLTSVTLELGGKSPTIVDKSADLKHTARRIVVGKFSNASQTCIAHDYIMVHHSVRVKFVEVLKNELIRTYGKDASQSTSLARIINKKNTERISHLIAEAKEKDKKSIVYGGRTDVDSCYVEPTLLLNPDPNLRLLKEEIFGPLIPIIEYDNIDEVIDYINKGEKPLALYVFSKTKKTIATIRDMTSSGSMNINETAIHYYHLNLPFGGVNNSGIGKAHGFYGFREFSNEKGILKQNLKFSPLELIFPPYTKKGQFWIDLFLKYF